MFENFSQFYGKYFFLFSNSFHQNMLEEILIKVWPVFCGSYSIEPLIVWILLNIISYNDMVLYVLPCNHKNKIMSRFYLDKKTKKNTLKLSDKTFGNKYEHNYSRYTQKLNRVLYSFTTKAINIKLSTFLSKLPIIFKT